MRYGGSEEKTDRNRLIYDYYLSGDSKVELARHFSLSEERIRQILKREEEKRKEEDQKVPGVTVDQAIQILNDLKEVNPGAGDWQLVDRRGFSVREFERDNQAHRGNVIVVRADLV